MAVQVGTDTAMPYKLKVSIRVQAFVKGKVTAPYVYCTLRIRNCREILKYFYNDCLNCLFKIQEVFIMTGRTSQILRTEHQLRQYKPIDSANGLEESQRRPQIFILFCVLFIATHTDPQ